MQLDSLSLDFLGHSGFLISDSIRIAIDPYHVAPHVEPVDLILITHSHFDHCSIEDIRKLAKEGTTVVGPADIQSTVMKLEGIHVQPIEVGDSLEFGDIKIEAVRAYNVNKYRDSEKKIVFHSKKEGFLGYVIKKESTVVYHAGDTDIIKEMEKLTGYGKQGNRFIALLPVSGTYVMTAEEASEAAALIKPEIAIPMHYGSGVVGTLEDAERFVSFCQEKGIHAEVLKKI